MKPSERQEFIKKLDKLAKKYSKIAKNRPEAVIEMPVSTYIDLLSMARDAHILQTILLGEKLG